jgi:hypothetical protein
MRLERAGNKRIFFYLFAIHRKAEISRRSGLIAELGEVGGRGLQFNVYIQINDSDSDSILS